jgi:NAD(P)-dependent dehydrogenase (short-subunit alcohol dehydrogenase family)
VQEVAEAGASVAVNDLHRERAEAALKEIKPAGGKLIAAPFDVANLEAVRAGIAQVEKELGPIDILINNAGIPEGVGATGPFVDSDPAAWHFNIDLNLYGSIVSYPDGAAGNGGARMGPDHPDLLGRRISRRGQCIDLQRGQGGYRRSAAQRGD